MSRVAGLSDNGNPTRATNPHAHILHGGAFTYSILGGGDSVETHPCRGEGHFIAKRESRTAKPEACPLVSLDHTP